MKFNDIANAISVISGVTLAGIVGVGVYTYANKDAIIDGIKEAAIEAVMGSLGDGLPGTGALESLPLGTNDLPSPSPQASMPSAPQAPVQF